MGFQSRHEDEGLLREELAKSLARDHHLELARSREVLVRAEQAATQDPQARSVQQWFTILVEEDARGAPAPGRRTQLAPDDWSRTGRRGARPAPGKETIVARDGSRGEAVPRTADSEAPRTRHAGPGIQWRPSRAFDYDLSGVRIWRDGPRASVAGPVSATFEADPRRGELPFRAEMEHQFGERLDEVAVDVAPSLPRDAVAAAERERIIFVDASPSKETVAHEVAHVLQYRRGQPDTRATVGRRGDPAEREAERAAADVLAGHAVRITQVPAAQMHLQERPGREPEPEPEYAVTVVAHAIEFHRSGDGLAIEVMWYALVWQEGRDHRPLREGELPPQFPSPRLRCTSLIQRLEEHTSRRMVPEGREALLRRRDVPLTQRDPYTYTTTLSGADLRQWFGAQAWQEFLDGRRPPEGDAAGAPTGEAAAPDAAATEPTVTVEDVLRHLAEGRWDVDDLAAQLTDAQMRSLSSTDRVRLIENISGGTVVMNDDERTIVRLLATTPSVQALSVRDQLGTSLLQQLDSAIDFDDFRDYNDAIRQLFFNSLTPEEAQEQMGGAPVFPWANPGLIHAMWNVRFYYEECELHDDGKVHISYWINVGPIGMRTQTVMLDPFEMIAVRFEYPEEYAGAERGQTIYMPAINLRSLHRHQFRGDLQTAVDVSLLIAGGTGLLGAGTRAARALAALDLAVAAADITIRDFRHEISRLEHGPEFLAAWDIVQTLITVYGVGRMALQAPATFRRLRSAFQRLRGSSPRLPPETLGRIEAEVEDVLRQADEAEAAAAAGREGHGGTGTGGGTPDGAGHTGHAGTPDSAATTAVPAPPRPSIRTADDLIDASEGRMGLPDPLGNQYPGHAGDHIPPAGADRGAAMAHAQLRPNKRNTTVYYSRRHALQDLRDALTAYADEIARLAPGQSISRRFGTPLRPGFNSVRGAAPTEVSFEEISFVLEKLPTGELHLVQFTPRLRGL